MDNIRFNFRSNTGIKYEIEISNTEIFISNFARPWISEIFLIKDIVKNYERCQKSIAYYPQDLKEYVEKLIKLKGFW